MGPRTGPRPASSTPRMHSVEGLWAIEDGMAVWCVYEFPARISASWIEGAMKTSSAGVS